MSVGTSAAPEPTISAILVCFNEEDRIGDCLESLKWCDEIVIVDSYSTDRTVEICRRYTDKIIQRPWPGYREQKAFAHAQAAGEWVLLVDADERVPAELAGEIREAIRRHGDRFSGFALPRLVRYLDRWWWRGGWYPDYAVRLFRRTRARWGGTEPHERVIVDGPIMRLENPLHHFSYRGMADHLDTINRFTTISSRELKREGCRWRIYDALGRPLARFFHFYVIKRGFMEGFAGFYVALTAALYVFLKYAKLWELELEEKRKGGRRGS